MAKIEFKAKVRSVYTMDDEVAYEYISVPNFKTSHCDMGAFRQHRKYGAYANSDLFNSVLARIKKEYFPHGVLKMDEVPPGVAVDTTGFLAKVSFDV